MKKYSWIIGIAIVTIAILVFKSRNQAPAPSYEKIESKISLNETQLKELPPRSGKEIALYRFRSNDGIWQVGFEGKADSMILGFLFPKATSDVSVPVYLCKYQGASGENIGLDLNSNCSGEGSLVQKNPAGFVASQIRTGFRMLFRCKSEKNGFYLSLNSHCESEKDRLQSQVGSILAEVAPLHP